MAELTINKIADTLNQIDNGDNYNDCDNHDVRLKVLVAVTDSEVPKAAAANDGSQVPDLVLADAVDATSADAPGLGYERGDFNAGALTLGTGHTVASIRDTLRGKGITLISSIPA